MVFVYDPTVYLQSFHSVIFLFYYSKTYICYTCLSSLIAAHGMISFLVVTSASLKMFHFELLTKRFNAAKYTSNVGNKGFILTFSTCALYLISHLGYPETGVKNIVDLFLPSDPRKWTERNYLLLKLFLQAVKADKKKYYLNLSSACLNPHIRKQGKRLFKRFFLFLCVFTTN